MQALPHILCVLNSTAGSGIALQRWPKIAALLESFQISYELLAAQDMTPDVQVSRRLEQNGPERYAAIAGIGGDGTHSAVINGLMRYRAAHVDRVLPPYVLIPTGTGNDMAKSFGLTARDDFFVGDLRRAVAAIRFGADYWLDLGCLDGVYFVNALTVGLDSHILREHNRRKQEVAHVPVMRRLLKGNLLYTWCVGLRFWRQKPLNAEIAIDGQPWYSGPIINLVINNTRNYGGEFVICPDAYANDGLLDVVSLGDMSRVEALSLSGKIYEGTHLVHPKVASMRGVLVEATPARKSQQVLLDMDGETPGMLPITARVLPGAVQVRT